MENKCRTPTVDRDAGRCRWYRCHGSIDISRQKCRRHFSRRLFYRHAPHWFRLFLLSGSFVSRPLSEVCIRSLGEPSHDAEYVTVTPAILCSENYEQVLSTRNGHIDELWIR